MLSTAFTRLVGVDHPILLAPMGGAVTHELALAVARAGGFPMLGASFDDPDELPRRIAELRSAHSGRFGINLIIDWDQHERLGIALDSGAPVVSLHWGDPSPYLPTIRNAGAISMVSVGSADDAKRAADLGVDVVVAQGVEAGGHVRSQVGAMVLLPAVVDAVAPLPVIAAGGIANGRCIAAALALGAAGAWIGTRFLATEEANIHDHWKARVVSARETDTVMTELFDIGWPRAPHRVLRNATYDSWEAAGSPTSGQRPGEGDIVARQADGTPILRYSYDPPRGGADGEIDLTCLYAGQSAGLVRDILPAEALVRRLVEEAESAMAGLDHIRGR